MCASFFWKEDEIILGIEDYYIRLGLKYVLDYNNNSYYDQDKPFFPTFILFYLFYFILNKKLKKCLF